MIGRSENSMDTNTSKPSVDPGGGRCEQSKVFMVDDTQGVHKSKSTVWDMRKTTFDDTLAHATDKTTMFLQPEGPSASPSCVDLRIERKKRK